jgi:hypothetical protein
LDRGSLRAATGSQPDRAAGWRETSQSFTPGVRQGISFQNIVSQHIVQAQPEKLASAA